MVKEALGYFKFRLEVSIWVNAQGSSRHWPFLCLPVASPQQHHFLLFSTMSKALPFVTPKMEEGKLTPGLQSSEHAITPPQGPRAGIANGSQSSFLPTRALA